MASAKNELKKTLLDQLNGVKEEDRLNFVINKLVNIELETEKSQELLKSLKNDSEKLNQTERTLKTTEKMLSKSELSKSKLEDLCRQLNKQKKDEAEASVLKLKKLEKIHHDTVEGLRNSLVEIQQSVNSRDEQAKKMKDVEEISKSLTGLAGEYEKRLADLRTLSEDREDKMQAIMKTKDEELNYFKKELGSMRGKVEEVFTENVELKKEALVREKAYREALVAQKTIEAYGQKYHDLVQTLESSNVSFEKARNDMVKMNGQLIKLQGEAYKYRKQLEENKKTIQTLKNEVDQNNQTINLKDKQLSQLQGLCRRLQKGGTEENENLAQ